MEGERPGEEGVADPAWVARVRYAPNFGSDTSQINQCRNSTLFSFFWYRGLPGSNFSFLILNRAKIILYSKWARRPPQWLFKPSSS